MPKKKAACERTENCRPRTIDEFSTSTQYTQKLTHEPVAFASWAASEKKSGNERKWFFGLDQIGAASVRLKL